MSELNQVFEETKGPKNKQEKVSTVKNKIKSTSTRNTTSLSIIDNSKQRHSHNIENDVHAKQCLNSRETESTEDNDSEYEDVESDEIDNVNELTLVANKTNSLKTSTDEDELHQKVKPRRLNRTRQDDEHSETNGDDDDNQNVPNRNSNSCLDLKKSTDKKKDTLDDDDDVKNPAYIPRKGKFYEHDDRTLTKNDTSKKEMLGYERRIYKDSDGKWEHDLYFQDEQMFKSKYPLQAQNRHRRSHFKFGSFVRQKQYQVNDYLIQPEKEIYMVPNNQQRSYGDYRRRIQNENPSKSHHGNINNKPKHSVLKDDLLHHLPNNQTGNDFDQIKNANRNVQVTTRSLKYGFCPNKVNEQIYHRQRNFTNSNFQRQYDKISKQPDEKLLPNKYAKDSHNYYVASEKYPKQSRKIKEYEFNDKENTLAPRFQTLRHKQHSIANNPHQRNASSKLSTDASPTERPRRYSNMRNLVINSTEQQSFSSNIHHYHNHHLNNIEPNDWPQAPPPPTPCALQQNLTSQVLYQQQNSRFMTKSYPPASMSQKQNWIERQEDGIFSAFASLLKVQFTVTRHLKETMSYVVITRFVVLFTILLELTIGGIHQRRLLKTLLDEQNYDPLERPVVNESDTLRVSMSLALQQIMDFDEKNEILAISGWLVLEWIDYNLQWKPEDYGGIMSIRLPSTRVWTPDVVLYNSASENFEGTMKTNLVLQHNGSILFVPPGILKSICPFNISSFPFDVQSCTLKFGSWSFDESGVNLTTESDTGQLDAYVKNAEWDLEAFIAVRKAFVYECCPTVYPFVLFTIQIRRRTLYYVVNVVVPCVIISFMTVLGFILPPDSGEKLTLQITILLSIVMFSLLISGIIPASSTALPIIVMYFTTVMCLCSLSVVATVFVLVLHHRNAKSHTMPMWVKIYINQYLACILLMSRPEHDLSWNAIRLRHKQENERRKTEKHTQEYGETPLLATTSKSLLANVTGLEDSSYSYTDNRHSTEVVDHISSRPHGKCRNPHHHHHHDPNEILLPRDMRVFRSEMRTIITELRALTENVKKGEEEDDISQDWRFSAMVLDRLCLIIFSILTSVLSYMTLFSAKNFFKLR